MEGGSEGQREGGRDLEIGRNRRANVPVVEREHK